MPARSRKQEDSQEQSPSPIARQCLSRALLPTAYLLVASAQAESPQAASYRCWPERRLRLGSEPGQIQH